MKTLAEYEAIANSAKGRGALEDAISTYIEAIKIYPNAIEPKNALARIYIDSKQWRAAEELCRSVLAIQSKDVQARYTLSSARLEQGFPEEAAALLTELIGENRTQGAIYYVRGRANLSLGNLDECEKDLLVAYNKMPSKMTLQSLANLYWMTGNKNAFSQILAHANTQGALAIIAADIITQSGDLELAEKRSLAIPSPLQEHPENQLILSIIYQKQGNADAARHHAEQANLQIPGRSDIVDALVCGQLMQGDGLAALKTVKPWRVKDPTNQIWIAHEAIAMRLLGDSRYNALVRFDSHVRAYQLPIPDGFSSVEAFNQAFMATLKKYRIFQTHPLDQSLRDGIQTPRGLYSIKDHVIQSYFKALETPIKQYLQDIGTEAGHPLTSRNTGRIQFNGSWSVQLNSGGKHVNHVHSKGWISSSYYVDVPPETLRGESKAGWIKFGEPPFKTRPDTPPEKWVQPRPGLLVLFPSFLWHGTEPILDGSTRVTAPFDLIPD